jgi:hypothetical protein
MRKGLPREVSDIEEEGRKMKKKRKFFDCRKRDGFLLLKS